MPTVFQGNVNDLKSHLPNRRTRLRLQVFDIMALQETRILSNKGHLAGSVGYPSRSQSTCGRAKVSAYVRKGICHFHIDLSVLSSDIPEYTCHNTPNLRVDATFVSVYVRPSVSLDPREPFQVHQNYACILPLCGDLNAHYDSRTDASGCLYSSVTDRPVLGRSTRTLAGSIPRLCYSPLFLCPATTASIYYATETAGDHASWLYSCVSWGSKVGKQSCEGYGGRGLSSNIASRSKSPPTHRALA